MYESKTVSPIPRAGFSKRLLIHLGASVVLLLASLAVGVLGYCYFEHLTVTDAFLNAAMLLGGMGPVNAPLTTAGKVFAGCFALYAGLVFIVTAAIIFTPIAHRILHKFHWDA